MRLDKIKQMIKSGSVIEIEDQNGNIHQYCGKGHTINVYYENMNIDVYSIGDFSKNHASIDDFLNRFMQSEIRSIRIGDDSFA